MKFRKQLGPRIRKFRIDRGLTQEELAALLGIHPTHVSNIERGKSAPGSETVAKLIGALAITPNELFDGIVWDAERGDFVESDG